MTKELFSVTHTVLRLSLMTISELWEDVVSPLLSTFRALGIDQELLAQRVPWGLEPDLYVYRCDSDLAEAMEFLHVVEGWQFADFFSFMGPAGCVVACHRFPEIVQGKFVHLPTL